MEAEATVLLYHLASSGPLRVVGGVKPIPYCVHVPLFLQVRVPGASGKGDLSNARSGHYGLDALTRCCFQTRLPPQNDWAVKSCQRDLRRHQAGRSGEDIEWDLQRSGPRVCGPGMGMGGSPSCV